MPSWTRILCALFVAYVAATAVHIGWVLAHEPFSFDAWNVAVDTGGRPFSLGNFFEFWGQQYTQSNPRLGQPLTYLTYKLAYVGEIVLPLAFLAISLAVTVLGLGRWPWRRARDLALWAIAIGFAWFVLPRIGRNLFCRAYGANYVFGAAVQLWFLVPLRLARSYEVPLGRALAYGLAGVIAGMCNEHTGPMLLAALAGLAWWRHRAGERPRLVWAGALGFGIGFAAIFFAPGQGSRYEGLAQQVSLPGRLLQRGIAGNLDILRDYIAYAGPLLVLIAIVLLASLLGPAPSPDRHAQRQGALRLIAGALAAGTLVAVTLFVSPKLGARFHFVGLALLLAGFLALVDVVIVRARGLVPLVALAVAASSYAAVQTMPLYFKVSRQAAERMDALVASTPGSIFVADAWQQVDESWWFIGDDFRDVRKRELVAKYFGLARVYFRGYSRPSPLGMAGIRIAPRYWREGASCAEEYDEFEFGVARGFDLAALHRGTRSSIELLQSQLAPTPLARFELEIEFIGARPPLPRETLLLSRWQAERLEAYAGRITRPPASRIRHVSLPPELADQPLELFIVQVGGEFRPLGTTDGAPLRFTPWRKGVYWAVACDASVCWVFAAGRA